MGPAANKSWKDALRPLKRKVHRAALLQRRDGSAVREPIMRAFSMGVAFHQTEVRSDPLLLEWVLKRDYFDYSLPHGWQRHISN